MPGSRSTSTARRPGSRRGGAVSTPRRSHTRRRDEFPASDQSSGVCSGLSWRARSCTDKPRLEGLRGLGKSSRARRGVERLRAGLCWWRGHGHGARGCGRPALALTSTCIKKLTARRPVHSKAMHATVAARPETRRGGIDVPARQAWREGQHPHTVLVWRRRARGHEWPEGSARARHGSTAARRPATRQGGSTAHPNAVGAKTEEGSRRREGDKVAAVVLTSGRRWSRGRLGGEVYEGEVEVHAGGRPPRLLLLVPG
jgi:hypothetical protein